VKKLISVLTLIFITLGISACNTMSGAGKDIQRGGEKLENSAEKSK
jgi:entericidin B